MLLTNTLSYPVWLKSDKIEVPECSEMYSVVVLVNMVVVSCQTLPRGLTPWLLSELQPPSDHFAASLSKQCACCLGFKGPLHLNLWHASWISKSFCHSHPFYFDLKASVNFEPFLLIAFFFFQSIFNLVKFLTLNHNCKILLGKSERIEGVMHRK